MSMKYNKIPDTDLNISAISLGTWVFGGDVWGSAPEKDCIDAVHAAIRCGINLIDTAPIYGYGRSEKVVGKAIKGKRDRIILATKCGLKGRDLNITVDLSPEFIREEIENSLRRLKVDCIDIYQCHWPDEETPVEETMKCLLELKKEGKIRYIGVSNFSKKQVEEALEYAPIATLQNHYSLLERSIEKEILGFCRQKGVGIITYGSLGGGILSGKYRQKKKFSNSDARGFFYHFYNGRDFERAEEIVGVLRDIAERGNHPLNQVALNWIRQKDGITSAIVGCRNSKQAESNAGACTWDLYKEDIARL